LGDLVKYCITVLSPLIKQTDHPAPLFEFYEKLMQTHPVHVFNVNNANDILFPIMTDLQWTFNNKEPEPARSVIESHAKNKTLKPLIDGTFFVFPFVRIVLRSLIDLEIKRSTFDSELFRCGFNSGTRVIDIPGFSSQKKNVGRKYVVDTFKPMLHGS
jgi:hypothetical protein